jgi:hypothetical protein
LTAFLVLLNQVEWLRGDERYWGMERGRRREKDRQTDTYTHTQTHPHTQRERERERERGGRPRHERHVETARVWESTREGGREREWQTHKQTKPGIHTCTHIHTQRERERERRERQRQKRGRQRAIEGGDRQRQPGGETESGERSRNRVCLRSKKGRDRETNTYRDAHRHTEKKYGRGWKRERERWGETCPPKSAAAFPEGHPDEELQL